MRQRIIDVTASSKLSRMQSGALVTLAKEEGLTVTLPAPGRGLEYTFVVKTAIGTSGNEKYTIALPSTSASVKGAVISGTADTAGKVQRSAGADKIELGSINGGTVGSIITMTCDNDSKWNVTGIATGTGDTTIFA